MIRRSDIVAMVIGFGSFMQNLDGTIVTTALPDIAASMNANPVHLNVVVTGYLLGLAVFIPVSGWLADRYGARTVFLAAVAVFTLSSLLCGLSNTVLELLAARIVQGCASAMVVPVGRLVLLRAVEKSELVRATAFLTVPAQIGSVVGPVLGGAIATHASWRWVFLINIAIGVLGIILTARYIDDSREADRRPFDWLGFVLIAASLCCILYAFEATGREWAGLEMIAALLIGGLALGALAARHARRVRFPLMDLSLLRVPTFAANVWGGSLFRVGWGSLPFLLPLLFQVVFGMDAFASGLLVFATAIGSVLIRMAGPAIISRVGFRRLLVGNGIVAALTMLACGFFSPSTPAAVIFVVLLVGGVFQALQIITLNSIAYADVEPPQMSSATMIGQLTQQLGKAFGVAGSAVLLHFSLNWRGGTQLSETDFLLAFIGITAVSAVSIPLFMKLSPDAGANVSGHRTAEKSSWRAPDR